MENYIKKLRVKENGVMIDKQIDYTALANLPAAATTETAGFVKPDGNTIAVDTDGTIHAVGGGQKRVTYAELKDLRDNGELVPGTQYRITDFVTTTSQPDTQSAGHPFDIIVTALSANTLSENASADYHLEEADVHCYYKLSIGTYEGNAAIVEFGTATNNNGEVVPVLYHGNDEGVNYDDKWFYIGTYDLEGEIFDRWQLIEIGTVEDGAHTWDSEYKKFILTNIVVQDNALTITDIGDLEIAYTIYDDDEHVYEGTQEGLMNSDKIVDRGYKENNMGEVVPVLYKTDIDNFADETDYADTMYYVGRYEYKGTTYDRWRKIEDNGVSWEDQTQYYVLTNIIVENNKFIGGTDPYFANAKLPAWEIKYCLDNDKTRFAWAVVGDYWIRTDFSDKDYILNEKITVGGQEFFKTTNEVVLSIVEQPKTAQELYYYNSESGEAITFEEDGSAIYDWGEENAGKGVIYYMKDEWGNECPYDFKNIQFNRYAVTATTGIGKDFMIYDQGTQDIMYSPSTSLSQCTVDPDTSVYYYTFSYVLETGYVQDLSVVHKGLTDYEDNMHSNVVGAYIIDGVYRLNDNVLVTTKSWLVNDWDNTWACASNTFGEDCRSNTLGNNCSSNVFGNSCASNIFGNSCSSNVFGSSCNSNVFGDSCTSNVFGNSCSSNVFGSSCNSNTLGNNCAYIHWQKNCQYNNIGNDCRFNNCGSYCRYNTFGSYCRYNTFGSYYQYNIVENGVQYVTLTTAGSGSALVQNITLAQGLKGTNNSRLQIEPIAGLSHQVIYRPAGSKEIILD